MRRQGRGERRTISGRASVLWRIGIAGLLGASLVAAGGSGARAASRQLVPATYRLSSTISAPGTEPSITSLTVDPVAGVVYAIDDNNERLLRIDDQTNTVIDSFALTNCNDPRRPAVAHSSQSTKIYIGCERERLILVLKVGPLRLGQLTEVARIPLAIPGNPLQFEPKTERVFNPFFYGTTSVYVVADAPEDSNCTTGSGFISDPVFKIDTRTDTIAAWNSDLGTAIVGTDSCGAQGANDIAPIHGGAVVTNEDNHRIYRVDAMLRSLGQSDPLTVDCSFQEGDSTVAEDAPKYVDVLNTIGQSYIMATSPESAAPCDTGGNGALFISRGGDIRYVVTPGFQPGRLTAARGDFIITDESERGTAQVRDVDGNLVQSIPLGAKQNDVTYDPIRGKAFIALDGGAIAVLTLQGFAS